MPDESEYFLVHMKLVRESQAYFRYRLERAPESLFASREKTIRPEWLTVTMAPDDEGHWNVDLIQVNGQRIVDGEVEERKYLTSAYFSDPLKDEEVPHWLREIAGEHVHRMNEGEAPAPDLREQILDLRKRQDEAAREAAHKMFAGLMPGDTGKNMADEIAEKIVAAVRRVG